MATRESRLQNDLTPAVAFSPNSLRSKVSHFMCRIFFSTNLCLPGVPMGTRNPHLQCGRYCTIPHDSAGLTSSSAAAAGEGPAVPIVFATTPSGFHKQRTIHRTALQLSVTRGMAGESSCCLARNHTDRQLSRAPWAKYPVVPPRRHPPPGGICS